MAGGVFLEKGREEDGRPGWDRTSNPQLRRLMLYPIELRAPALRITHLRTGLDPFLRPPG